MPRNTPASNRKRTARKRASVKRRKKADTAKAAAGIASEALNRTSTVVALEYFMPHFVEGSFYAVAAILFGSLILFIIRSYHIFKGDTHDQA